MFRILSALLVCAASFVAFADGLALAAGTTTPKAVVSNITIDPSASKTTSVTEPATNTGVTFAGTASNSIVPSSFIDTALRYGDVIVTANGNVSVNPGITLKNTGASNVLLRADEGSTGVGTVKFGPGVQISRTGTVSILFNPSVNAAGSIVNAISYVNPTENYSRNVTGGPLTAYMLVNTVYDLQNMQNNLSGKYALGKMIEASPAASWNSGAGFAPIGGANSPFTGLFTGASGSTPPPYINHLSINSPAGYLGLFGYLGPSATISNLSLTNVSIKGSGTGQAIGALFGFNRQGQISNSNTTGSVTGPGNGEIVGGFGGYNYYGSTLLNSYSQASVTGGASSNVGGFVAANSGSILHSYATGTATGGINSYVGGFTAANVEDANQSGTILQSYSSGAVVAGAKSYAGGFAGNSEGIITDSYSTGAVNGGTNSYVGGFTGYNYVNRPGSGTITESYSAGTIGGNAPIAIGAFVGVNAPGTVITNSYSDIKAYSFAGQNSGTIMSSFNSLAPGLPSSFDPTVWASSPSTNGGYPYLLWQMPFIPIGQLNPNHYSDAALTDAFHITQNGASTRDALLATFVYDQQYTISPYSIPQGKITLEYLAGQACLSSVYTMIARAIGNTMNNPIAQNAAIDLFQQQGAPNNTPTCPSPGCAVWPNTTSLRALTSAKSLSSGDYATLLQALNTVTFGALTPIGTTNIGKLLQSGPVILHGPKVAGDASGHWILATQLVVDQGADYLVANEPLLGAQVRLRMNANGVPGSISDIYDPKTQQWITFNQSNAGTIMTFATVEPQSFNNQLTLLLNTFVPIEYESVKIN